MAGFNSYAAAGVPTPKPGFFNALGGLIGAGTSNPLYRRGATGGTFQGDPLGAIFGGRPAAAGTTQRGFVTSGDADLGSDPGRMFPKGSRKTEDINPLPGDSGRTSITSPNTTFQHADEEYKTLLSQYGGAPGISQLAGMASLPTGFTPTGANRAASLKDYYAAQNLQGNANMGTIIQDMGYTGDMAKWAKLHPALAQQQYAKKQAAASYGGYGTGQPVADPALQGTTGSFFPGDQSSPAPIGNPPLNPMMGGPALNSAVSPQTAYNFKFGSENFGTPDNSVITGAANFTPAPPADVHRADFNNRMDAVNYQKARTNLENTLPDFSAYWNSPR